MSRVATRIRDWFEPVISSLVEHNLGLLGQGLALLGRLDDGLYTSAPPHLHNASVGAHVRHCLDFYECLLDGLESGLIDHSSRVRDAHVERNRLLGILRVREAAARLSEMVGARSGRRYTEPVFLRVDHDELIVQTTPARELEAAASHTIHHYAVIAVVLRAQGLTIPDDFGVAPSTLRFRAKS